jgi:hypothetical protein
MPGPEIDQQLRNKQRRDLFVALLESAGCQILSANATNPLVVSDDGIIDLVEIANARAQTNSLHGQPAN